MDLYDRIINPCLLIRRVTVAANHLEDETQVRDAERFEQLDLFTDYAAAQAKKEAEAAELARERQEEEERLAKERKLQEAMLSVKKKFGKNALLKGINLQEGATTIERNHQIGGHKA